MLLCHDVVAGRRRPPSVPVASARVWPVRLRAAAEAERVVHVCPMFSAEAALLRARCGLVLPVADVDVLAAAGTALVCGACLGAAPSVEPTPAPGVLVSELPPGAACSAPGGRPDPPPTRDTA
ncbi:hypothetical protein FHR81_000957 [Actinoalloteichus hoggarensis]|uniref:Uncharacterized protein n=1 Tax=Actinoalloteichus hoggarensis TaxID=1470176 RepID=A0A221VYX4_9PSEU|nr:hypothetical protein [Actinoalloteichus hoggarensis]ASO18694.1 hypothetical protein AHOG_05205 [Actinoalloteichus hoggarensis]MBB5919927.1 hypothetical protein [Actinoalloteichus hoggarensis]